jgi:hypothetical protein
MALTRLISHSVPEIDSERRDAAVLRVHLYALLLSPRLDTLSTDELSQFRKRWECQLKKEVPIQFRLANALRWRTISFRILLRTFKSALGTANFYQSSRKLPRRLATEMPWTFQTTYPIKEWWFDRNLVPEVAKAPSINIGEAIRIQEAFEKRVGLQPGASVGNPAGTLWVTNEVARHERAHGYAGRLRDALGLIDKTATEYVFLVQLGVNMSAIAPLQAPTAFDAGGYPRFRPWPHRASSTSPDTGRTYELDSAVRRSDGATHGRQELVIKPHPLDRCEQFLPLGHIGWDADDTPDSAEDYADEVAPRTSVRQLIAQLDAL